MTVRDIQKIQDAVAEYWPDVRWVETRGSTNADLLADSSAGPGTVLIADEQAGGKIGGAVVRMLRVIDCDYIV